MQKRLAHFLRRMGMAHSDAQARSLASGILLLVLALSLLYLLSSWLTSSEAVPDEAIYYPEAQRATI